MHAGLIISLSAADTLAQVGGKALALGTLLRAGFTVPGGFVLSTQIHHVPHENYASAALKCFDELGVKYVAVRSSGTTEDGAISAWAGQFDSFLNVTRDTLIEAVDACMASASSNRARSYANQNHADQGTLAVIVQTMVQSDVSGVAFSVHPVTHDPNTIVIEAGLGLGEAIVSGEITPDNYTFDKTMTKITSRYISAQDKKLSALPDGSSGWQAIPGDSPQQKLGDAHIYELADLVGRIEQLYDGPQDIEWALADNTLYILQSRPITTLN